MPRRPAAITQADVARALRAAEQCRAPHVVEITPDGVIRILPAALGQAPAAGPQKPALDGEETVELI